MSDLVNLSGLLSLQSISFEVYLPQILDEKKHRESMVRCRARFSEHQSYLHFPELRLIPLAIVPDPDQVVPTHAIPATANLDAIHVSELDALPAAFVAAIA